MRTGRLPVDCGGQWCGECRACEDAFDLWEAQQPEREQRRREQLDAEGYYDDPEGWHARQEARRDGRTQA